MTTMTTEAKITQVDMPEFITMLEASSKVEGEVYVGATTTYFAKPFVDWEKLYDVSRNIYITEHLERLRSLLFIDQPEITVLDPNGKEDPELAEELEAMVFTGKVDMWAAMQKAFIDMTVWGPAIFNPVWKKVDNEVRITELRRLPPESFGPDAPTGTLYVYSEILRGIVLNDKDEVEYWQTTGDGKPEQLKNITMMMDPVSTELAGTSKIVAAIPVVDMLTFAWQAQMQRVNRIGAPSMWVKITNPQTRGNRDDWALAKKIVQNWGKNTAFTLPENMEIIAVNVQDSATAETTIERLERRLQKYFTPATLIQKEGDTIGGNAQAEADLVTEYIKGQHQIIEGQFQPLLETYLEVNGFIDYRVTIDIPEPEPDQTQVNIQKAQAGFTMRALSVNEIRELLGKDPLEDDELEELAEAYAAAASAAAPPGGLPGMFGGDGHGPPRGSPAPGYGPGSKGAEDEPQHRGWGFTEETTDDELTEAAKDAWAEILAAVEEEEELE